MLRLLCERKDVDINKQDGGGSAALHHASSRGQVGCMRILLDMGKADADTLNGSSYTALHIAAYNGHLEAAALLIERGAKVNLVSRFGDTPLDWAHAHRAYQNTEEMIALLKSKGAKRKSERKTHSRYSFIRCSWQRCTIFNSLYPSTLLSLLCQARRMQLFSSLSV